MVKNSLISGGDMVMNSTLKLRHLQSSVAVMLINTPAYH